jgi:hypothetical protein
MGRCSRRGEMGRKGEKEKEKKKENEKLKERATGLNVSSELIVLESSTQVFEKASSFLGAKIAEDMERALPDP